MIIKTIIHVVGPAPYFTAGRYDVVCTRNGGARKLTDDDMNMMSKRVRQELPEDQVPAMCQVFLFSDDNKILYNGKTLIL